MYYVNKEQMIDGLLCQRAYVYNDSISLLKGENLKSVIRVDEGIYVKHKSKAEVF